MSVVLDASAILALLLREPGSETVSAVAASAVISSVNAAEVYSKATEKGVDVVQARRLLAGLGLRIASFDDDHAYLAGILRHDTRKHGLSLGDRACLATAMLERLPVLTADRAWLHLGLAIEITAIR